MSTSTAALSGSKRLTSLDVFRGLTLAGMILVNNPGTWSSVFAPLRHAAWNGWTPTDLVFPSFLFIVGTAITFAFDRRRANGDSRRLLLLHALRRAIVLFALGLLYMGVVCDWMNRLPNPALRWSTIVPCALIIVALGFLWPEEDRIAQDGWGSHSVRLVLAGFILIAAILVFFYFFEDFQASQVRVPGVLQRIALCYLLASIIVLYFGVAGRIFWTVACLAGYWAILRYVHAPAGFTYPVKDPSGLLHAWIDTRFLSGHLYSERPDPEGLLSTLPAVGTTLLGVLAGDWLRSRREPEQKAAGLFLAGIVGLALGLLVDHWMPINKKIWTSSYVLFAGGCALYMLAWCYLLIDVDGWRRWAAPFLVLGTNCIAIYMAASLTGWLLGATWQGHALSTKGWLHAYLFQPWFGSEGGSLAFGLCFVLLWVVIFTPLYRARIFIRV